MFDASNNRGYKQHQGLLSHLILIVIIAAVVTTVRVYAQAADGEIHGTKWHDLNGNGIHDPGEPGLSGVIIYLDQNNNAVLDAGESSTITDANGNYAFTNLPTPFTYTVSEVITPTWFQSYPNGITVASGNLLVTALFDDQFFELTETGTQVRSEPVPFGSGTRPGTEIVRDIVVGPNGLFYIYNGTFNPYLSIYDPDADSWQHLPFSGWSTVNNVSYGGIAIDENYVYLTDMFTWSGGNPSGIVRFNTTTFSSERYASTREYIDLTRGLDGHLYALRDDGRNSGGRTLDVYDLGASWGQNQIRTISLGHEVRGVAVNAAGEIFGADWDDFIYHFSANGTVLNSVNSGGMDLTDIDIASDGTLVVGERFGNIILTDETLSSPTIIANISRYGSFVAFASPAVRAGSHRVLVQDATPVTGIDFGNYTHASLGGWVWEDKNGNGEQDSGETGIEGVTVNLIDLGLDSTPHTSDDQVFSTTVTDALGYYSFDDISPESYYVEVVAPVDYHYSPQDNASDDYSDSDVDSSGFTDVIAIESDSTDDSIDAGLYSEISTPPDCVPVIGPILYENNFEDGVGDEWSNGSLDTSPTGRNFLGQFNNSSIRLTISCLPAHEMIQASFDLYIIRSWDGDTISWQSLTVGPDLWRFGVDNDTILETTFSNWSHGIQSYPKEFPNGDMPAFTGASKINTLGYKFSGNLMDAVYHLSFLIPHQADELELDFSASGLQSFQDESWGIDNIEVRIIDFDKNIYLPIAMR